jgi:hypothetical protein
MAILHRTGHLFEENPHEGRGDGHHQEHRQDKEKRHRRPADRRLGPCDFAHPWQGEGFGQKPAHQRDEGDVEADQQGQRQSDTQTQNHQEPAVRDLAQSLEKGGEDHVSIQSVIASVSGRGRSIGSPLGVPRWTKPATTSGGSNPRPARRKSRSRAIQPVSQWPPNPAASAAFTRLRQASARRLFLFHQRDRRVGAGRADDRDRHRRVEKGLGLFDQFFRVAALCRADLLRDAGQPVDGGFAQHGKAEGNEFPVIGHAGGCRQQQGKRGIIGGGRRKHPHRDRATGQEKLQGGARVHAAHVRCLGPGIKGEADS